METIYLVIVIALVVLAVSDLVVGVSNDAVNFLNSAIGAKAAPVWLILGIASIGIMLGATFSSGIMEVARKGIFHPDQFYFNEIMIIFLAVMITDILLLDFFNTWGLPTSTTVSIVFELLGAAVAVSLYKISVAGESLLELGKYINSDKALAIISGILLSVVIAFAVGALIMYFTRLLFTFQYKKRLRYFGSIWGGAAITVIIYFILIKGAKGSSFISDETLDWIMAHTTMIVLISFAGWTTLLQFLVWTTKLNVPKVIVLVGTFALAMAFAGNDLVNFIGVPLAGLSAYKEFLQVGHDQFLMTSLAGSVNTPTFLLLAAGIIMTITLWTSKKARSVTRTELNLARQSEGEERFGSTLLSRSLVRIAIFANEGFNKMIPESTRKILNQRFTHPRKGISEREMPAFDMIRASTNLTIASILIAFATSLKLPLSTTYVTFMVAMGTSLSDRAWGRESAVYRITGVFTVIGGWFLTALTAFVVSALFAVFIYKTQIIGIVILIVLAAFVIFRTHIMFRRKESKIAAKAAEFDAKMINGEQIIQSCSITVSKYLKLIPGILEGIFTGLSEENARKLKKVHQHVGEYNAETKELKDKIHQTIVKLEEDSIESGHYYVQVIDYLREVAHCLRFMSEPAFTHVDNQHKGLIEEQKTELHNLSEGIKLLFLRIDRTFAEKSFTDLDNIIREQHELLERVEKFKKRQVKRIKNNEVGTRNSMLYFNLMEEIKNMLLYTINLLKAQRDFITYHTNRTNNAK